MSTHQALVAGLAERFQPDCFGRRLHSQGALTDRQPKIGNTLQSTHADAMQLGSTLLHPGPFLTGQERTLRDDGRDDTERESPPSRGPTTRFPSPWAWFRSA